MKHTIRTRIGGALLSFAMVLSLLPVSALAVEDPSVDPAEGSSTSAPAEGTQGSQAGTASDPTNQSIIEIDSNDDLVNAIKEQADGQTWVFTKKGTYDVKTPPRVLLVTILFPRVSTDIRLHSPSMLTT